MVSMVVGSVYSSPNENAQSFEIDHQNINIWEACNEKGQLFDATTDHRDLGLMILCRLYGQTGKTCSNATAGEEAKYTTIRGYFSVI